MYNFRKLSVVPLISHSLVYQLYISCTEKSGKRKAKYNHFTSLSPFSSTGVKYPRRRNQATRLKHVNWYCFIVQPSSGAAELASTFSAAQESSLEEKLKTPYNSQLYCNTMYRY